MKNLPTRNVCFAILFILVTLVTGCEKDDIDEKINEFSISAFNIDFDKNKVPDIRNYFFILKIEEHEIKVSEGKNEEIWAKSIELPEDVTYSFEINTIVYGSNYADYKNTYTGTIPRSSFTKTDKSNVVKVEIKDTQPTVYLNDIKLSLPTKVGACTGTGCPSPGSTGAGACPVGTWKTPTCNGAANKFLIYHFGPLNSNGEGEGYASNPDCNNVCSGPLVFRFRYTISGNKITYHFTSTDNITCNGTTSKPNVPNPAGPYSITYTCGSDGTLLTETVNTQTGVITKMTFTKQ